MWHTGPCAHLAPTVLCTTVPFRKLLMTAWFSLKQSQRPFFAHQLNRQPKQANPTGPDLLSTYCISLHVFCVLPPGEELKWRSELASREAQRMALLEGAWRKRERAREQVSPAVCVYSQLFVCILYSVLCSFPYVPFNPYCVLLLLRCAAAVACVQHGLWGSCAGWLRPLLRFC